MAVFPYNSTSGARSAAWHVEGFPGIQEAKLRSPALQKSGMVQMPVTPHSGARDQRLRKSRSFLSTWWGQGWAKDCLKMKHLKHSYLRVTWWQCSLTSNIGVYDNIHTVEENRSSYKLWMNKYIFLKTHTLVCSFRCIDQGQQSLINCLFAWGNYSLWNSWNIGPSIMYTKVPGHLAALSYHQLLLS